MHWIALLLGLFQGLTEFLPISSSGHFKLLHAIFNLPSEEGDLPLSLVCHLGTAAASLVVFRRDIYKLIVKPSKETVYLIIAVIPLVLVTPFVSKIYWIQSLPHALGLSFLVTASLLFASEYIGAKPQSGRWFHALGIGAVQTIALTPGISRSGSTISAARLLGWSREQSVRFSFLLSLPTIMGSCLLHAYALGQGDSSHLLPLTVYCLAFTSSAVVGYLVLRQFLAYVQRATLKPFAWYCLVVGILVLTFRLA